MLTGIINSLSVCAVFAACISAQDLDDSKPADLFALQPPMHAPVHSDAMGGGMGADADGQSAAYESFMESGGFVRFGKAECVFGNRYGMDFKFAIEQFNLNLRVTSATGAVLFAGPVDTDAARKALPDFVKKGLGPKAQIEGGVESRTVNGKLGLYRHINVWLPHVPRGATVAAPTSPQP